MREQKEVNIDGHEFKIFQFSGLKATILERKILMLIAPAFTSLIGSDSGKLDEIMDSTISYSALGTAFVDQLSKLSDQEYITLILDLFSGVTAFNEKGRPISLADRKEVDDYFVGKTMLIYKLAFEVMKVNNFSFFALLGDFGQEKSPSTDTSSGQSKTTKKNGGLLEKLEV